MTQTPAAPPPERLSDNDVQAIDQLRDAYARLRQELGRVIVGQHDGHRAAGRSACSPAATPC